MLESHTTNSSPFSGKIRVRACGMLIKNDKVLLLNHHSVGPLGYLWSPPGGGVEFGQSLHETLKREFMEETNLKIEVEDYLFTNEHIDERHHAIELFFSVRLLSGELTLGTDPELASTDQILTDARYFSMEEIRQMPKDAIHSTFSTINNLKEILNIRGLITFKDY